jgi:uncharacterized protein YprB with RNaseH-like and TPR domain
MRSPWRTGESHRLAVLRLVRWKRRFLSLPEFHCPPHTRGAAAKEHIHPRDCENDRQEQKRWNQNVEALPHSRTGRRRNPGGDAVFVSNFPIPNYHAAMFLPGMENLATCDDLGLDDLARHLSRAAFFDIETEGLGKEAGVTMIACLLGNHVDVFTRDANLDEFLSRIESADLLVSFNGATFDEPKLLDHFRIPNLPRPHLDLRKLCKVRGITGGLKQIEKRIGLFRPADIAAMSGEDADWMWRAWEKDHDEALRRKLLRYCAADVVALRHLAAHLLGEALPENPWALLSDIPAQEKAGIAESPASGTPRDAAYERLRAHHRKHRNQLEI